MSTPAPDFAPNRPLRRPIPTARALRADYYAALARGGAVGALYELERQHAAIVSTCDEAASMAIARRVGRILLGHRDTPGE